MTYTLTGRVISKKNSKQIFRAGGRTIISTSKAYKTWHEATLWQLKASKRPPTPLDGPLTLTIYFYLKGKIDADLDNLTASICDVLTDAEIIADDKHITELHLFKRSGAPEFSTSLEISQA